MRHRSSFPDSVRSFALPSMRRGYAASWKQRQRFTGILAALVLIASLAGQCLADPVDLGTARIVAEGKLRQHVGLYGSWNGSDAPRIADEQPVQYNGKTVAYEFVIDPGGHILVAVDDDFSPILLYSTMSGFEPGKADKPSAIESWIVPELYYQVSSLERMRSSGSLARGLGDSDAASRIQEAWSDYAGQSARALESGGAGGKAASARSAAVSPLLSTTWAQDAPYNLQTPNNSCPSGHTLTGCVATAWAQLMRYWRWPVHGTGTSTYDWNGGSLSVDFSKFAYDWDNMPDILGASSSQAEKEAVSLLMYHVGVSANMNFGCEESQSTSWANDVLDTYFDYKSSMQFHDRADYVAAASWFSLFKNEFDADPPRPVVLSIFVDPGPGGHEVVADGYQTDPTYLIHVNFGWSGNYDGYYNITSKFSAGGYEWKANTQMIVVGIEPNNSPPVVVVADNPQVDEGGQVRLSGSATDPEGLGIGSYRWTQLSGPSATLSDATSTEASFTAPNINSVDGAPVDLVFQFRADDVNRAYGTATCTVRVLNTDESAPPPSQSSSSSSRGGGGGGCFISSLD